MAWLAIAPLLGSLALCPAGRLASSLAVMALLAGFAVANSGGAPQFSGGWARPARWSGSRKAR